MEFLPSRFRVPVRGSKLVLLATLLASVSIFGGCVRRVVEITSEPSGATVWLNDREVGSTPCDVEILHYGVYDVRVTKVGYEPLSVGKRAAAPVWDLPGPDLVAELLPFEVTSRTSWHLALEAEDMSVDSVIERAVAMRDRLVAVEQTTPAKSQNDLSDDLAAEVERANGEAVEPGQPVGGPLEPVEAPAEPDPSIPGLDPGSNPGQAPDLPPAV
ncbi:MAG: hypothetical protein CMJ23_14850 [Phycisphaerae bacterium]|nr:hypothetical protein [Phycisphaerae bacterium]